MLTKVVFIAGAGRSGSTFLSQLLSQNDDCQNVGQIRHLPMSMAQNRMCSCGKSLKVCDLWGHVAARMVRTHGTAAMSDLKNGLNDFQQSAKRLNAWSTTGTRNKLVEDNSLFLQLFADFYHFSSAESGGRALIDSSKLPGIALALNLAKGIDLYTINLVRDPRAVSVSWAKLVNDPGTLKQRCRNWNKRNAQMSEIEQIPDSHFLRIRYEDFAADPRSMIEDIQEWAGLEKGTLNFTGDRSANISWNRTHLFPPANEEVLEKKATHIDIRPSESWKSDANTVARKIAQKINFPQAVKVGYSKTID